MLALLGEFVRPGSLVFDVGANHGEYTELFAKLGAKVVAIEPNPVLAPLVKKRVAAAKVVNAAVGAEHGSAELFLAPGDGDSTLSDKYADILVHTRGVTLEPVRVDVVTLDELASENGQPQFVKIDVEGFEPQVLAGMSFKPDALSFEFHGSMLDELDTCLTALEGFDFRISLGNTFAWATNWVDRAETMQAAEEFAATDPLLFADVYARLPPRRADS
jgi:FkbM family methyltransferase